MNDLSNYIKDEIEEMETIKKSILDLTESEQLDHIAFLNYVMGKLSVLREILDLLPKDNDNGY